MSMDVPHEAVLLRIFTGADDRYNVEEPLYRAIVAKAREMHLAGATVLKGPPIRRAISRVFSGPRVRPAGSPDPLAAGADRTSHDRTY
jgi:hypothetical protein